jgi:hypothetical protein
MSTYRLKLGCPGVWLVGAALLPCGLGPFGGWGICCCCVTPPGAPPCPLFIAFMLFGVLIGLLEVVVLKLLALRWSKGCSGGVCCVSIEAMATFV